MPPEAQAGRTLLKSVAVARHALTLLVAGLLAATATAFAVTERLKLEDSPVFRTQIHHAVSPSLHAMQAGSARSKDSVPAPPRGEHQARHRGLERHDRSQRSRRRSVRAVVPHVRLGRAKRRRATSFRTASTRQSSTLLDEKRTFDFPQEIRVDSTRARDRGVDVRHAVFSPDGDGRADRVDVRYRSASRPTRSSISTVDDCLAGATGNAGRHEPVVRPRSYSRASTGWPSRRRIWPATWRLRRASSRCTSATSSFRNDGMSPAAGRFGYASRRT